MKRNKKAERERRREGGVFNSSPQGKRNNREMFLCLAKHEIMNVTLFFTVNVTAYMIG